MDQSIHLKSEISDDKPTLQEIKIEVEDVELKFPQDESTPTTSTNEFGSINITENHVKKENTHEIEIKQEIIEFEENEPFQMNDNLDIVKKQEDALNIKISSVKSESIIIGSNDQKSFLCSFCEHETASMPSMIDHVQIHLDLNKNDVEESEKSEQPTQFVCDDCGHICTRKSYLITHMKSHVEKKQLVCKICDYKTVSKFFFNKHIATHTTSTCGSCVSNSVNNARIQCIGPPYACGKCNFSSDRKIHLINHLKKHAADVTKPFKCMTCGYKCNKQSTLLYHHRNYPGAKPYCCKLCDFKTCLKYIFSVHSKRHTGKLPFACEHCDYKSSQLSHVVRHQRTHTGERPFACSFCSYRSNDKSHLVAHYRKHTGEKPYTCDYCEYKSITKSNLINHVRKHTGEKPYECEQCEYKGATKGKLLVHLRKHNNKKYFMCKICCTYKTCDRSCLKDHIEEHRISEQRQATPATRTYSRRNGNEKKISCKYCDFKCMYPSSLVHHEKIHIGQASNT